MDHKHHPCLRIFKYKYIYDAISTKIKTALDFLIIFCLKKQQLAFQIRKYNILTTKTFPHYFDSITMKL